MFKRYLSAELLRSRGSAVQWLPLLALPLALMTIVFSAIASPAKDATGVLGWQSMFVTGMYAPLVAVFAAVTERREVLARGGGTLWRRLTTRYEHIARLVVVLASLGAFHLLNFGVSWAVVFAQGREQHHLVALAGLYSVLGAIGIAGLASACSRRYGLGATLILSVIWQVSSVTSKVVEGPTWWAFPPAWPMRLMLHSLHIHQNSVPLDPGDPLLQESPLPALALTLLLAAVGVYAAIVTPRRLRRLALPRRGQTTAASSGTTATWRPATAPRATARPRLVGALVGLHRAACSPAVIACLALSALALLFLALFYPPTYVQGFFIFLLLPVGAGVLPVVVWPLLAPVWPLSHIESRHCSSALLWWLFGIVSTVCVGASLALSASGSSASTTAVQLPLAIGVGYVISVFSLLIVIRLGIMSGLALCIVCTIVSVTLGGDVLARTPLWLIAFPAWPMNADSPARYILATVLIGIFATAGTWMVIRLLKTKALRPAN